MITTGNTPPHVDHVGPHTLRQRTQARNIQGGDLVAFEPLGHPGRIGKVRVDFTEVDGDDLLIRGRWNQDLGPGHPDTGRWVEGWGGFDPEEDVLVLN